MTTVLENMEKKYLREKPLAQNIVWPENSFDLVFLLYFSLLSTSTPCGKCFHLIRLTLLLGCNWGQELTPCVEQANIFEWETAKLDDTMDVQTLFFQSLQMVRNLCACRV